MLELLAEKSNKSQVKKDGIDRYVGPMNNRDKRFQMGCLKPDVVLGV